ncbi:hypothetical protein [Clostridium baratii]|uniref:Uncharacterized protein n=1 Tax=Clostridium baratii TaxID=1561 RepID=A0A174QRD8_9CLOT|nr:hypothetical protein [Clostridium baratii]CUP74326.1 Uncharacterised protein [Clostridium baratii]
MDLEESLEIISDVITQKFEDRSYFTYIITNILNEKPITYKDWMSKLKISSINDNIQIDKEKRRKSAKNTLKNLFN